MEISEKDLNEALRFLVVKCRGQWGDDVPIWFRSIPYTDECMAALVEKGYAVKRRKSWESTPQGLEQARKLGFLADAEEMHLECLPFDD